MGSKATEITSLVMKRRQVKSGFDVFFFNWVIWTYVKQKGKSQERDISWRRINSFRFPKRWKGMRSGGHREGLSLDRMENSSIQQEGIEGMKALAG